jgi:hypothetical protein
MMLTPSPLPAVGQVYVDGRGGERTLRVSWHHQGAGDDEGLADEVGEGGVVVLSLWRDGVCVGSFRMEPDQVRDLVQVLRSGLPAL